MPSRRDLRSAAATSAIRSPAASSRCWPIGRALMTNPKLLILDEATEGLAPLIRQEIWDRLASLKRQGLSILVIDKNVDALLRLSDRHLILEKGQDRVERHLARAGPRSQHARPLSLGLDTLWRHRMKPMKAGVTSAEQGHRQSVLEHPGADLRPEGADRKRLLLACAAAARHLVPPHIHTNQGRVHLCAGGPLRPDPASGGSLPPPPATSSACP